MSTQNSGHSPTLLSVTTPFRSLRLLEVPDDLLNVITSIPELSETKPRLKFKSAPPQHNPGRTQNSTQKEGVLHLCVDGSDKAWAVKQVSTSNSVYLIEPTKFLPTSQPASTTNDETPTDLLQNATAGAVTAVAQVGNFLELHPVKIDDRIVEKALVDIIPVYHPLLEEEEEQMDIDLDRNTDFGVGTGAKAPVTWEEALNNVAAPDDIVLRIGQQLGIFEDTNGNCMIPSTRVVSNVWSSIVEGSAIEGVNLDQDLSIVRVVNMLIDNVESSLAEKLLNVNGTFDQMDLFHDDNLSERKLKPEETCHFIAGLILSSHPQHQMDTDDFIAKWTDLVPASFVKYCTVESLTPSPSTPTAYELTSDEDGKQTIKWTSPISTTGAVLISALSAHSKDLGSSGATGNNAAEASSKPAASSAAADKKRKWHEKFGAQRSMKK